MNVALLGTGLLGEAVAERAACRRPFLSVYNRSAGKTQRLRQLGVAVAPTAAEAMSKADVVLLLLADEAAIRAVLLDTKNRSRSAGGW